MEKSIVPFSAAAPHALVGGEGAERLLRGVFFPPHRARKTGEEGVVSHDELFSAADDAAHLRLDAGEDAAAALFFVAGGGEVGGEDARARLAGEPGGGFVAGDLGREREQALVGDGVALFPAGKDAYVDLAGNFEAARRTDDAREQDLLAVQQYVSDIIGIELLFEGDGAGAGRYALQPDGAAAAHDPFPAGQPLQLGRDEEAYLRGDDGGEDERTAVCAHFRLFDAQGDVCRLRGRRLRALGAVGKLRAALRRDQRALGRGGDDGKEQPAAVAHLSRRDLRPAGHDGGLHGENAVARPVGKAAFDDGLRAHRRAGIFVFFVTRLKRHGAPPISTHSLYARPPPLMPAAGIFLFRSGKNTCGADRPGGERDDQGTQEHTAREGRDTQIL